MTTELDKAARSLRAARSHLDRAMVDAAAAARNAHSLGEAETVIATALGVNRMTVRRWLGKLP